MLPSNTYTHNLDEIPELVALQRKEAEKNFRFRDLQEKSRGLLQRTHGISQEQNLILYGEQADPLIIKNTGKAFLSAIIENQLKGLGMNARSVYIAG